MQVLSFSKPLMTINKIVITSAILALTLTSCFRVGEKIEPQVSYTATDSYLKSLPSSFPALSQQEKKEPWGTEYLIAKHFAKELDLYRAITNYKRALILLDDPASSRYSEIEYDILLSYYLGKRYSDAIHFYTHSGLVEMGPDFPAYHDMLVILYESYLKENDTQKAGAVFYLIAQNFPETAKKIKISTALTAGDIEYLEKSKFSHDPEIDSMLKTFYAHKKSVHKAQLLNACIPGAGYWYVGQKQSAMTAFLLNGLFIYAAIAFFDRGFTAAGIITLSFEAGWYFGGIYGAGEAAKLFNERLYERMAHPYLSQKNLFPVLMLKKSF
jgi:tetratricopeptide (TPR) repeat protein